MFGLLLYCFRCGHQWKPRIERRPLQCPKCTSRVWDVPRQESHAQHVG